MDLLGYLRQEAGHQKAARGEGAHGAKRRNAQALLLARLPSSLKQSEAASLSWALLLDCVNHRYCGGDRNRHSGRKPWTIIATVCLMKTSSEGPIGLPRK